MKQGVLCGGFALLGRGGAGIKRILFESRKKNSLGMQTTGAGESSWGKGLYPIRGPFHHENRRAAYFCATNILSS